MTLRACTIIIGSQVVGRAPRGLLVADVSGSALVSKDGLPSSILDIWHQGCSADTLWRPGTSRRGQVHEHHAYTYLLFLRLHCRSARQVRRKPASAAVPCFARRQSPGRHAGKPVLRSSAAHDSSAALRPWERIPLRVAVIKNSLERFLLHAPPCWPLRSRDPTLGPWDVRASHFHTLRSVPASGRARSHRVSSNSAFQMSRAGEVALEIVPSAGDE